MMKILILFLIYSNAYAYSPEKLEKERQSLFTPVEIKESEAPKKIRSQRKKLEEGKSAKDLEALYFDEITTKAAAPIKRERRKRTR